MSYIIIDPILQVVGGRSEVKVEASLPQVTQPGVGRSGSGWRVSLTQKRCQLESQLPNSQCPAPMQPPGWSGSMGGSYNSQQSVSYTMGERTRSASGWVVAFMETPAPSLGGSWTCKQAAPHSEVCKGLLEQEELQVLSGRAPQDVTSKSRGRGADVFT